MPTTTDLYSFAIAAYSLIKNPFHFFGELPTSITAQALFPQSQQRRSVAACKVPKLLEKLLPLHLEEAIGQDVWLGTAYITHSDGVSLITHICFNVR